METKQTTRTIQQVRIALALEKAAKDAEEIRWILKYLGCKVATKY